MLSGGKQRVKAEVPRVEMFQETGGLSGMATHQETGTGLSALVVHLSGQMSRKTMLCVRL